MAFSKAAPSEHDRRRHILPLLPLDWNAGAARKADVCRVVSRRREKISHAVSWSNELIDSLNLLYCGSSEVVEQQLRGISKPSAAQQVCASRIFETVRECGPPPSDLDGSGALSELRAMQA